MVEAIIPNPHDRQVASVPLRTTRTYAESRPNQLEAPALTTPGTIRITLSREDGPAGHGDDGAHHWHLAMSLSVDRRRGPAPIAELAAWIAAGWPQFDAVDT